MLLGDPGRRPDQLEVGLDHRRAAERDRRIALGVQPARELVALRGCGPLDPLHAPDRRARRAGQHQPPPGQPPLLGLGVQQRERHDAAREHRGQPAPRALGQRSDRAVAILGVDDPHAAEAAVASRPASVLSAIVPPADAEPRAHPAARQRRAERAAAPPSRRPRTSHAIGAHSSTVRRPERREREAARDGEHRRRQRALQPPWAPGRAPRSPPACRAEQRRLAAADRAEDASPLERTEAVS